MFGFDYGTDIIITLIAFHTLVVSYYVMSWCWYHSISYHTHIMPTWYHAKPYLCHITQICNTDMINHTVIISYDTAIYTAYWSDIISGVFLSYWYQPTSYLYHHIILISYNSFCNIETLQTKRSMSKEICYIISYLAWAYKWWWNNWSMSARNF